MSLDKLRVLPEFQGASDAEILGALSKTAGVPLADVASAFGADTGGKWGNRLSASIDSYQAGLLGVGEAAFGSDTLGQMRRRNEAEANLGRSIAQRQGAIMSYKDVGGVGDALDYVGGLAVDSAPYLVESLAGGLVARGLSTGLRGVASAGRAVDATADAVRAGTAAEKALATRSTLGGVAASYPSAVGDILQNQREQSGGETDLGAAALGGLPYAALNALGIEGALSRGTLTRSGIRALDDMAGLRGVAARTGVSMLKNAAVEAPSELGQEFVNQYFGRMAVDPNETFFNDQANERYLESAIGGAALGGVFGGAAGGWRRSEGYVPPGQTLDDQSKPTSLLGGNYNLTTDMGALPPLQQRIDQNLGLTLPQGMNKSQQADYTKLFNQAYNEPSGRRVVDPATGIERELTVGELLEQEAQQTQSGLGDVGRVPLTLQPYGPTDGPLAGAAPFVDLETLRSDLGELAAMAEVAQRSGDAAQLEALNAAMRQTFDQIKALETQGTAGQSELFFPNGAPTYGADAGLPNLTTQLDPLQQRIDQNLGLTRQGAPRNYPQQFQAAASEPTNLFAQDPATGREIRLDMGQASQIRAGDNVQLTPEQIRAQEVGAAAAQEKQAIEGRKERTAAAGLDPKKVQHVQAWSYIEEALDNGVIDQPEAARLAANVASGIDKVGGIQKYLTGLAATKQAIADGKAQETQAALDKVQKQPTNGTPTTQAKQAAPKGPQAAAAAAPAAAVSTQAPVATAQAPVEVAGTVKERVQQRLNAWAEQFPQMPKYDWLSNRELAQLEDLENRGELNLSAAQTVLGANQAPAKPTQAQESDDAADFRRNLTDNLDKMGAEDRFIFQEWLGVDVDEDGNLELRESGGKSYASIGAKLPNSKTGQIGMSREAVRKKVNAALKDLGYEGTVSPKMLHQRLGFALAGTDLETINRNVDLATQDDTDADPVELDQGGATGTTADGEARAAEMESGTNDDVGTKEDSYETDFDAARQREQEAGILRDYLADDLTSGRVLESDIEETRYVFDKLMGKGAGAFNAKPVSEQAAAVRQYAPIRARGTDPVVKIAQEGVSNGKRTQPTTSNPEAVPGGAGQVREDQVQDGDGRNGGTGQAGQEVRQAGNQAGAQAVVVKKKRRVVTPAAEDRPATPFVPRAEATVATDAVTDVMRDLRSKSHEDERPGDVMLGTTGAFVRLADAVAAARQAMTPQQWAMPFQFNRLLDIAPRDFDRMVEAMRGESQNQLKSALNNTEGLTLSKDQTTEVEIDDLLYAEGFADAQQTLDTLGIGNASDWVSEWRTHDQIGDEYADGWLELVGSRYVLTLKEPAVKTKTDHHLTFTHEVGHAVDMAPHGGVYSAQPEMSMRMVDGNLVADGEVAQELQSLYDSADPFWEMLGYPLDSTAELIPDVQTAQSELFAQAFSLFTHPKAARKLKADAPLTYQFLTEVAYDIQRSKPRQIQTAVQAAQRRSQFAKRNGAAAQGNGVLGQARQGSGTSLQPGVPGRTRFARPSQTLKGLDKPAYMSKAPSELWETAQGAMAWLKDWTFTRGAFTRDLLNKAAELMPAAKTYLDEMQRARVESVKLEREVASIVDDASALAAHERGTGPRSINALIRRMTYENKWAFAPEWVKNVKPDAELAEWFDGLSKEAQAVVKRVFKHGHDSLLAAQRAAIDSIESEVNPLIDAARAKGDLETVKELEKAKVQADGKFRRLIEIRGQTPYAPLRRFGNWAVVVKSKMYQDAEGRGDQAELDKLSRDDNHYRVEFKSNRLSATTRVKALQQELGDVSVQAFERSDDALLYGGESMFKAFSRFRNLAREKLEGEDAKVVTALDKTLASMYMALVAETSARTSEFERKNVAGADMDMMRAFATQGRAMANFIGSLKTSGKIMDTLRTMKKQTYSGTNQAEKSKLYNEILRRHAMGLNYEPNQLLDKSLAANSYWSLITSPSYLLTNLTQPWVVSVPVLAGKFGLGRSSSEMMRAYKEIGRIATKLVDNPDAVKDLPKDVQAVVSELFNRGSIDISLGADLGSFTSGGESELSARTQKILRLPRTLAERGEMVNRVATAVAAYRLAKAQKMSTENAIDYADKVIYETHGDYSAFNSPRVMRNPVGRFATQFRKFQLIQIALYGRLIKDATKSLDPKERKAAQQALLYTLGTTFALGGLTAMPGYTAISFLAGSVLGLGDDDEPDDPEATLRRLLGGGAEADAILRGVPNLMGLNIGSRIGAAGMLSILPYTDLEASRDGYKDILLGLAGPFFGGTLPKALDGVGLISNGDYWKGLELLMPRGVADGLRGWRFFNEGVSKRNGDVTLSADEINFFEMALQAVGLPPKDITDNQMLRNSQFKADEFYKDRTSQLKRQYVEAYRDGDGATMQEVRQSWMETQDARRRLGIKVQPLSELLKAPQEQRKRESKLQEESLLLG